MDRGQVEKKGQKIKNKMPAPVQVTAEQLLREAADRSESVYVPPKRKVADQEELDEIKLEKRRNFENAIRRQRTTMSNWLRYAAWEEQQNEVERARKIYERGIDVDYKFATIWIKYAEMEMRHKFINHARNVFDRAVTLLPRQDQFWLKFVLMEEQIGNFVGARQLFERWMQWHPDDAAWKMYIKFELRHKEYDLARGVYERYVASHPSVNAYLKYAGFEEKGKNVAAARAVYERAMEALGEEAHTETFFVAFAEFEQRHKEVERTRAIYRFALDNVPRHLAHELYKKFVAFERASGDRDAIEDVVFGKRRFQYEELVRVNPQDYDTWFDYARLEEAYGDQNRVREVYERAIACMPPAEEKRFWRRYIFLWINYALYEELETKDLARARSVWRTCVQQIPHASFSFAKIWLMYANFEVRRHDLSAARLALGQALGLAPKQKLFVEYIALECKLGEFSRARKLYEKWLEWNAESCECWVSWTEMENSLGEKERVRSIFDMAVAQPVLDMPERVWKAYIDFELAEEEQGNVRLLYRRLLERTKHVKVWISFALFEWQEVGDAASARRVFSEAYHYLRDNKEERALLSDSWLEFERDAAVAAEMVPERSEYVQKCVALMPKRVKKKRLLKMADGSDAGWEEYYDYIFPDEETLAPSLKILERARLWKQKQEEAKKRAAQAAPASPPPPAAASKSSSSSTWTPLDEAHAQQPDVDASAMDAEPQQQQQQQQWNQEEQQQQWQHEEQGQQQQQQQEQQQEQWRGESTSDAPPTSSQQEEPWSGQREHSAPRADDDAVAPPAPEPMDE